MAIEEKVAPSLLTTILPTHPYVTAKASSSMIVAKTSLYLANLMIPHYHREWLKAEREITFEARIVGNGTLAAVVVPHEEAYRSTQGIDAA